MRGGIRLGPGPIKIRSGRVRRELGDSTIPPDYTPRRVILDASVEAIEHQLVEFIRSVYLAMGWPGVVGLMALESACVPIPSEVIMPLSGWMLVRDRGLDFWDTLAAGFYGALGCT